MKILRLMLVAMLLAGFFAMPAANVYAQTLTFTSCIQVQNLDNAAGNVTITYYPESGAAPIPYTDPTALPALGSRTYCPLGGVSAGFSGSAVISSDVRLAAISNITGGNWSAFDGSFVGAAEGASPISLPLLMKANYSYNTQYTIQNAGSLATTVNITYSDGLTNSFALDPGYSKTIKQADEAHAAGWVGSATVTSNNAQPLVGVVLEIGPTMLFAYTGFTPTDATELPVFPLVSQKNYGYTTGIQIQNTTATSTDVTVAYTPTTSGTACTETQTIAGNTSKTFAINAFASTIAGENCDNVATFVGSARVSVNSANVKLVGIVNQHNFGANKGAANNSFNSTIGTSTVVFPLVMDRNYGYFTGFNIMNVGTATVNVSCAYTGKAFTQSATGIAPNGAATFVQLNTALGPDYVGGGTCTATGTTAGTVKIVGVLNESLLTGTADTFLVYEGFNR